MPFIVSPSIFASYLVTILLSFTSRVTLNLSVPSLKVPSSIFASPPFAALIVPVTLPSLFSSTSFDSTSRLPSFAFTVHVPVGSFLSAAEAVAVSANAPSANRASFSAVFIDCTSEGI